MQKFNINNKRKGFTLIEMILVLGLSLLISLSIIVFFSYVRSIYIANQTAQEVNNIVSFTHKRFASKINYNGLDNDVSKWGDNAIGFPSKYYNNQNSQVIDFFKNKIDIKTVSYTSPNNGSPILAIYINLSKLNNRSCSQIASKDYGNGLLEMDVNSQTFITNSNSLDKGFKANKIANACSSKNNQITFIFR